MIYVFALSIIYTSIKQKDKLLSAKRNLILFLFLSVVGIVMGIIYLLNPYIPSITYMLEDVMN